jgi:death on curing protein
VAEYRYLTADDVLALAERFLRQLGYPPPVLRGGGRGLLESAVNRAHAAAYYADADLAAQAAALANGIALNHPLVDANKRGAWAACLAFLWLNGRRLPAAALVPLARKLIELHEITDRTKADAILAEWLRAHVEPE